MPRTATGCSSGADGSDGILRGDHDGMHPPTGTQQFFAREKYRQSLAYLTYLITGNCYTQ